MLRNLIAVVLGIIGGGLAVGLIQQISHKLYGSPQEISLHDTEGLTAFIQSLPTEAFLFVIFSHALGALLAGLIASKLSSNNHYLLGIIAAFAIFLATLVTVFSIPGQPEWVIYADPFMTVTFGWLGAKIGSRF